MDYHIVPNLSEEHPSHSHKQRRAQHNWHFEATLFGAGMLILLLPLVANLYQKQTDMQVLGTASEQVVSERVYDSEFGYYELSSSQESPDIIEVFASALRSLLQ